MAVYFGIMMVMLIFVTVLFLNSLSHYKDDKAIRARLRFLALISSIDSHLAAALFALAIF